MFSLDYIRMNPAVISFCLILFLASGVCRSESNNSTSGDFSSSNLPIVLINTEQSINADKKVTGTMKIISHKKGGRNSIKDKKFNYNGLIGIKWRGNSSLSFDQKQYTMETRFRDGSERDVSLLDMPADNDWMLHAPYNDISLIRNTLAYHLWSEMGHWGPRTRMVELVLNNVYQGIYVLTETIKRSKNRVDIAKLDSSDTSGLSLTGGYIMRIDASNDEEDLTFVSSVKGLRSGFGNMGFPVGTPFDSSVQMASTGIPFGGFGGFGGGFGGGFIGVDSTVVWMYFYPKADKIKAEQQDYIKRYIDTVEQVIQSNTFSDSRTGYARYIDVPSFVDYFIHTELSLNADGFKRSAYFYKGKVKPDGTGGKLVAGPVWDFNLAFGNCNFCNAANVKAWVFEGCETNPTPVIWKRLIQDPAFLDAVKRRYTALRKTVLSEKQLFNYVDTQASLLDEAKDRHFSKWNDLLKSNTASTSFMMMDKLSFNAYRVSSYAEEIQTLKKWLSARLTFLDEHFLQQH